MRFASLLLAAALFFVGLAAEAAGGGAGARGGTAAGARRTAVRRTTVRRVRTARVSRRAVTALCPVAVAPAKRFLAEPQPLLLHGSVTAGGRPLPGATVWVAGKLKQMGVADAQGNFTLLLPDNGPVQLNYEAVGYRRARVVLDVPSTRTLPAVGLLATR
ncbi:carboxypeptidase-like regulatory domain-containing protein [Hymenobacter caeli]|uniref:Carboxypeptidase-like regulatory domain-containing protein n=1 Tax=Hymenobacter caeli TaxID=2735894 RepID=A0ABX2FJK0_9BACT|nr:carboxypeptidase-like regulatory domain-containing protein [Hymenobacter caeli]NRT17296.1 hypothetical protein [Hymenobacter caeli]